MQNEADRFVEIEMRWSRGDQDISLEELLFMHEWACNALELMITEAKSSVEDLNGMVWFIKELGKSIKNDIQVRVA